MLATLFNPSLAVSSEGQARSSLATLAELRSFSLQHRRLGHLSNHYLQLMKDNTSVLDLLDEAGCMRDCTIFSLSKNTKKPHSGTRPRAKHFLENFHIDLSGIFRTPALGGEHYYVLFCDNVSMYRHTYGIKDKAKFSVLNVFEQYIALA